MLFIPQYSIIEKLPALGRATISFDTRTKSNQHEGKNEFAMSSKAKHARRGLDKIKVITKIFSAYHAVFT